MLRQFFVPILIVLYVFVTSYFIEPNKIVVKKYDVVAPELAVSKVVFISDLHLERKDYDKLKKIVSIVNNQNPNAVLFGGDYLNYSEAGMMNLDFFSSQLNQIKAQKYAVLGEYDNNNRTNNILSALNRANVHILRNSTINTTINRKKVSIVGIENMSTDKPDIQKALRGSKMPRILLTHNPDLYFDIHDDMSIILAGHTHGGQFALPFSASFYSPSKSFEKGMYKLKMNEIIVSSGIGMGKYPFRFNRPPEIVVINFVATNVK